MYFFLSVICAYKHGYTLDVFTNKLGLCVDNRFFSYMCVHTRNTVIFLLHEHTQSSESVTLIYNITIVYINLHFKLKHHMCTHTLNSSKMQMVIYDNVTTHNVSHYRITFSILYSESQLIVLIVTCLIVIEHETNV